MPTRADLVIPSQVDAIARARGWLAQHAHEAGFQDKDVRNLTLALSEACANVIEHAYCGQPDLPIEIHLMIDETKLELSIRDVGLKFDVSAYQPPDLDQPHEGGYGVFIIRSLMDEVEYDTSGDRGTILRLVKYRRGASPVRAEPGLGA